MGKWLILLSTLAVFTASAAPAWRWIDANGVFHYSDRPVDGAVLVQLPDGPGARATPTARPAQAAPAPQAPREPEQPYSRFDIVSPAQQETLWNIGGNLPVQIALQPGLQTGHTLDVVLDGDRQMLNMTGPSSTLSEVFRGVHTIQAVIVDAGGTEVLRSLPIQFMVQQTSILNPNNPNTAN